MYSNSPTHIREIDASSFAFATNNLRRRR